MTDPAQSPTTQSPTTQPPTTQPFGARLREAMDGRGPLCAGIDPHAALLDAWGLTDSVNGLEKFALTATEVLAPQVAAIKPQSAFFERFGSRGVAVLEQVIATAREAGALVVLDVKRGDIGTTAQAYADAYLDPRSPVAADAITAAPYLGFGSLAPMFATAREHGTGVFVLALTSNPEAPPFQHARTSAGATVAGTVLSELAALNGDTAPLGSFGAVVGATIEDTDEDLAINGPLLVPGIGAQGGTADDVRRIFGDVLDQVLPASSREILSAGPDAGALHDAVARSLDAFIALRAGR
jgi:orotidine-5'-phosphate decarboxylase